MKQVIVRNALYGYCFHLQSCLVGGITPAIFFTKIAKQLSYHNNEIVQHLQLAIRFPEYVYLFVFITCTKVQLVQLLPQKELIHSKLLHEASWQACKQN